MERLQTVLDDIDDRGYKAYKRIQGEYEFPGYRLCIDHAQGDPFAEPSRCRIQIDSLTAAIPEQLYSNAIRRTALEDFFGRLFALAITKHVRGARGSGHSGEITIVPYGQQVLRRNSVLVTDGALEVRFQLALPANGRSITAEEAREMLFQELPQVVTGSLLSINDKLVEALAHVESVEEQQHLRGQLQAKGLVAFIGDGAILPRMSGIDDHPLPDAVPFVAPDSMALELESLHQGTIRGLGIPEGVTLIVGGGFHGKSTLLHAIEYGVYDHVMKDGRERVVTVPSAGKIRAEDRRAITGVDITPFINNLPQGKGTRDFTTQDASGSTSQAANIVEILATGTCALLIDEDTSATNFMIRDQRMQALVAKEKEPITPLVKRIRSLYSEHGVSVVLVMGGSGDFFASADHVLMLDNYLARDVTSEAKRLAGTRENDRSTSTTFGQTGGRVLNRACLSPQLHNKEKIQPFDTRILRYGREEIDLSRVEQLVDKAQLQAIGYLMACYHKTSSLDGVEMIDALQQLFQMIETEGLDRITPYIMGTLAMPRIQELAATINRMRNLQLVSGSPAGSD
ncbi:MAG: ABC-ATPase domain-containing protein [Gammaproteobacteria bacterium]|nr:ABC-ATPase domain-containing protein [Gammaproteobacteria bacterium]